MDWGFGFRDKGLGMRVQGSLFGVEYSNLRAHLGCQAECNLLIAVGKTQFQPHWRGSPVGLGWLEQAIEFFGVCVGLCLISAKLAVMSIFVQC